MNKYKIRLIFITLLILCAIAADATTFATIDGICYEINGSTASVTSNGRNYAGVIVIPSIITYKGKNYPVTSIGNEAFYLCQDLDSVLIPNSVKSIRNNAFYCSGVQSVSMPNSVKDIGQGAFYNCSNLFEITIPDSVTTIYYSTFKNCSNLIRLSIPASITSIASDAFVGCTAIKNLTWNAKSCSSLGGMPTSKIEQVIIGNEVQYLPTGFMQGSSLHEVIIPNSLIRISERAFYECDKLEKICISESVQEIMNNAFGKCAALKTLIWNAQNCTTNGDMFTTNITEISIGDSVSVLPEKFIYNSKVTEVTIPNSVKCIENDAFAKCNYLTNITLPSSLTTIGSNVFSQCINLSEIIIGENVSSIGTYCFYGCTNLLSITIGKSVDIIGDNAFTGCSNLTNLTWNAKNCSSMGGMQKTNIENVIIGGDVKFLPQEFIKGSKISSVVIPNSLTNIAISAFQDCSELTFVKIPDSVTIINEKAFYGCSSLPNVNLPNTITNIGNYAFSECSSLISVNLPNSLNNLGNCAFSECSSLISVNLPNSLNNHGYSVYRNCKALSNVNLGDSIKYLNEHVFYGCTSLKTIKLPNSIVSIGYGAFQACSSLSSIVIPSSVTSIGWVAFHGCSNLKDVIILSLTPPSANNSFSDNQLIYVPSVNNYKDDEYYSRCDLQGFYVVKTKITKAIVYSNNDEYFKIKSCKLTNIDKMVINTSLVQGDSIILSDLMPDSTYNIAVSVTYEEQLFETHDGFSTNPFSFKYKHSIGPTQTTYTVAYSVDRDDIYEYEAFGLVVQEGYYGDFIPYDDCGSIIETTNDSITIEYTLSDLIPNTRYCHIPWVQYKGEKYSPNGKGIYIDVSSVLTGSFITKAIDINAQREITPTSAHLEATYSPGDAVVKDAYYTFDGEKYESLYRTGLNPNTTYNYTYTIETTSGNQVTNSLFHTPSLSMDAQSVRMLTNTTVMLEAQTNMIDEETMVGFEWRRYDAPGEMPSTKVYSPVFGGKIAGTLKNLAENVYYKYRPFYTSNSGKSYYGNWVAFLTADAGVEYEPMVYTYNSPAVTQTEATLQGVALRGSDEITEQGFEYWKSGNNMITKVCATGERMSKKVSGLQSSTKYTFRTFLISGGETHYGNEVEFITLSNSHDVNLDGEINIADINAVINIILSDSIDYAGDVNGDGEVNIADINCIIDIILSN